MEENNLKQVLWKNLLKPTFLIGSLLTYSIGVGLSHYLGEQLDWLNILYGSFLGMLLFLMQGTLTAYFDHPSAPTSKLQSDDSRFEVLNSVPRQYLLNTALIILTAGAFLTVILIVKHALSLTFLILLGLGFLMCFFSAVPPFQWGKRGYGELIEAVLISNLIPALGFLLSSSNLQVLVITLTFPLTLLYLAVQIVFDLETYAYDRTHGIQSLVTRMDWQKAMAGHNIAILGAFLFTVIFSFTGQPWSLTWPNLLSLGIGVFEIIQIQGILNGAPARWKLLKWTAVSLFAITAYLISFSLWIG